MKLFTADRVGTLSEGMSITLNPATTQRAEMAGRLVELYPHGLSAHGRRYVIDQVPSDNFLSWTIEAIAELVRRDLRPDAPSRFDCMFACDSADDAARFGQHFGIVGRPAIVWEIEATTSFRADMTHLRGGSLFEMQYCVERYWCQESSERPQWEHLVTLPARVVRRVG